MNNRLHKVIFNRNTGLMIAVCETACNNGKSSKDKRFQVALFGLSGSLQSDIVKANADEMNIIGSDVTADRAVLLTADKVNIASTTSTNKDGTTVFNQVGQVKLTGKNADGLILINAQDKITTNAANIENNAQNGQTVLTAKDIDLGTITLAHKEKFGEATDKNHRIVETTQEVGSNIQGAGDIKIIANDTLTGTAVNINSQSGTTTLYGENSVDIKEGRQTLDLDEGYESKSKGLLSSKTTTARIVRHDDEAIHSNITGKNAVIIGSRGDVNIVGANIVSGDESDIPQDISGSLNKQGMSNAQNNTQHKPKTVIYSENGDVNIQAAQNFYNTEEERTVKKSGLLGTGGIGFTIGQQKTKTESDNTALIHSSSMVGSLGGDTQIYAGKNYSQVGSTVSSVGGETTISADKVDIVAAQNRNEDKYKQTFEQKGLTIALSSAITDLAQSAYGVAKSAEKVGKSKNNRVNAMAAFNTGYGAYSVAKDAGKMMGVGQGASAANGKNPQGSGSAVKVSITYGQQKNTQESNSISTAAQASEVFGDKVNITARKDGINIIGSDVSGSTNTDLSAAKNVNIASFEEIYTNRSQNKSFGWNAGVAVEFGQGMSFGFTGGANYGKGHENADSTTHRNSHVGSTTGKTTITAGETLNIKGGQVAGKGVDITAKDLNIESLQDTMTYDSRQENISGSVTVGYGVSGSASYSKSKVNADYASVNEQSGIFAGDDGYQINVQNHTDLKGGLITSTDRAEMDGKNSFSTGTISFADIANRSKYSGSSFGVGLSGSMGGGERMPKEVGGQKLMTLGSNNSVMTGEKDENGSYKTKEVGAFSASKTVGFGRDSDSQSSVTRSGINTANITVSNGEKQKQLTGKSVEETIAAVKTDITTDNYAENSGSLKNNFDAQEVQAEIDLQREVRQDFDQNRQNLKKDLYAVVDKKRAEAEKERKEHGGRETEKSKKLDQEANDLDEKVRWIDMGLGLVWGGGNSDMAWSMYATTQADRAYRAGTAPKEMWYQKKVVDEKTGEVTIDKRQIWSLNDLTPEEQASIRDEQGNVITVSNPGILNNREDALKNAAKQNLESTNKNGVIVVMNPATGKYGSDNWTDKLWLISTLPSELIYVGYDQINNKFFQGVLPKTNSEELNQEIYQQAKDMGYMIDTSNHSRGGITASVALKDWVRQHKDEKDGAAPIRKARFYGTATNVQNDYADVLQKNGYTYQGADGQTYNSGAYSIVHKMDFVGNKWIPFLLGNNETSPYNNCKGVCYSHSSYFAEVPEQYERDKNGQIVIKNGNPVVTKDWEDYTQKWGKPEKGADGKYINHAIPELVKPNNQKGEKYENKPF